MSEKVPADIMNMVLAIGKADWSQSKPMDDAGHLRGFEGFLNGTRLNHKVGDETIMNGLITAETPFPLSIATVGNSPNSELVARALCGAWNNLVDRCREQKASQD